MPDDLLADRPDDPLDPDRLQLLRPPVGEPWPGQLRDRLEERGLSAARLAGLVALALVVGAVGWWLLRPPAPPIEATLPVETAPAAGASPGSTAEAGGAGAAGVTSTTTTMPADLIVHAAGAVDRPGLYQLAPGARVADVIDAAGGLAPAADADRINLAAPVADGERVYVLHRGEAEAPPPIGGEVPVGTAAPPGGGGTTTPAGPVDLNTATAEQLDSLPGVGPSTAQAIIDYRTEHGRFGSVDDLLDVRGIGDAKLAALRARVTV